MAAVDKLKSSDVTELTGFKAATPPVEAVAHALCLFFKVPPLKIKAQTKNEVDKEDWWVPTKKNILNAKLLNNLKNYPKDTIQQDLVDKCNELFKLPAFDDKALKQASNAAFGIGKWCKAIIRYDEAMKVVRPKEQELKEAKAALASAEATLAEAQGRLDAINAELKDLVDELEATKAEENRLRAEKDKCEAKVQLATTLIQSLKSERENWGKLLEKNKADKLNIEGDVLIGSGIMAYLGVFTTEYRQECINSWVEMLNKFEIKSTENINLIDVLGNQVKISKWTSQGLPQDNFSIENAIIMDYSDRWPLMIDPQM